MTREEAINIISQMIKDEEGFISDNTVEAHKIALKALEREPILDKIRADIEQLTSRYSISKERGGMGQVEWSDRLIKESDVLKIIDKYKTESEGEE